MATMTCLHHHLGCVVVAVIVVIKDRLCVSTQVVANHSHVHTTSHRICAHILRNDLSLVVNVVVDLLVNMTVTDMRSYTGVLSHSLALLAANHLQEWMLSTVTCELKMVAVPDAKQETTPIYTQDIPHRIVTITHYTHTLHTRTHTHYAHTHTHTQSCSHLYIYMHSIILYHYIIHITLSPCISMYIEICSFSLAHWINPFACWSTYKMVTCRNSVTHDGMSLPYMGRRCPPFFKRKFERIIPHFNLCN